MIVILGGGLAGMSTAYHLAGQPHVVLEADGSPGGLCRSREIDGFVFDYTGHLLHLRDERARALVDELLPDAFDVIERNARIRTRGVTLPFPFQANLHGLPGEVVAECLIDFVEGRPETIPDDPETSFADWSLSVFGRGISRAFMWPYNEKLFRRDPAEMTADWVSWAVPRPSLSELVRGALGIENRGMGYNSTFLYPREGGIGALPAALARRVPNMQLGRRVTAIDMERKAVRLEDGDEIRYDELVSTLPLPGFISMLEGGDPAWRDLAGGLDWSVVACLNLGVARPQIADGAHWVYFPDADAPFYRVGFPSNFSPKVAPPGHSSMYVEFGLGRDEPFEPERLEAEALRTLRREGYLAEDDLIVAKDWIRIDPGYVIFDQPRQAAMARLIPELAEQGIHTIGRYGAWTYSYMERALLDGLELAERFRGES